ncbi:MAG: hypothetical protein LBP76_09490 [Treponema sp.]|jgi:hypothetical protein|nr:hypothetical protein [Treponema sp.]
MKFNPLFWMKKPVTETKSRTQEIARVENFGGAPAEKELVNIYAGENHDYDLSAGSYSKNITIIAMLIGTPILPAGDTPEREAAYKRLQRILFDEHPIINKLALINGTHWVFPQRIYGKTIIEHIRDSDIGKTGIRQDPVSKDIKAVVVEQQVVWMDENADVFGSPEYADRLRHISEKAIKEKWTGNVTKEQVYVNPFGIMPIPYAFNSLGDYRGISAYAGILRMLGDAHSIRANRDKILSKYRPQAVINTDDPDTWIFKNKKANGESGRLDVFGTDVKFNATGGESFSFVSLPSGAVSDHNLALEDINKELITSSMLPEIFSGKMMVGNYASSEFQQIQGLEFIRDIRRQFEKADHRLINSLAQIDSYVNGWKYEPLEVNYDNLNFASDVTKAQILSTAIQAMGAVVQNGFPQDVSFKLLKELLGFDYENVKELKLAIEETKASQPADPSLANLGEFF